MSYNSFPHFNLINMHRNCLHGTARYLSEIISLLLKTLSTDLYLYRAYFNEKSHDSSSKNPMYKKLGIRNIQAKVCPNKHHTTSASTKRKRFLCAKKIWQALVQSQTYSIIEYIDKNVIHAIVLFRTTCK